MSRSGKTEVDVNGTAGMTPGSRMELDLRGRAGHPGGRTAMRGSRLVIGREEGDLRIDHLLVSRQHAEIARDENDGFVLTDLASTNGTFLNGQLLVQPAPLRDGDDLRIGPAHLHVHIYSD